MAPLWHRQVWHVEHTDDSTVRLFKCVLRRLMVSEAVQGAYQARAGR